METSFIRAPAVADQFYPASPDELEEMVNAYLREAKDCGISPRAVIAPHAGFIFSGPVAATAYAAVRNLKEKVKRIAIFGPAHKEAFIGLALSGATAFRTPLGDIPVDQEGLAALKKLPHAKLSDSPHSMEHCIEVQLPFLQLILSEFTIVPVLVCDSTPQEVAEAMAIFADDPGTLILVSSDLSHYHSYQEAKRIDALTVDAIKNLAPSKISPTQACGFEPVRGLLHLAKQKNWLATCVHEANSQDTSGMRGRVVGYASFLFHEAQ